MAQAIYQVFFRQSGERVEAGRFSLEGEYDALDNAAGAVHLRANREQYGYAVEDGLVYFGAHAVPLSQFEGLEVVLSQKATE